MHTRSAAALERILADYFEIPVEVEQFVGAWQGLRDSDLCRFDRGLGVSEQLGGGAIVGDEIWNQQAGVRVKLGPLGLTHIWTFCRREPLTIRCARWRNSCRAGRSILRFN